MPLALKKEALAIASGDAVYSYSYSGHRMKLAEFPGEVTGLAVYKGKLLASGDFKGIRDVMTGEIAAGGRKAWIRVASWPGDNERLYATTDQSGIFELPDKSRPYLWRHRNGRTNVLYGSQILVDAGDYEQYASPEIDFSVKDSYIGDIIFGYGWDFNPVTSFVSILESSPQRHYFSQPLWVNLSMLGTDSIYRQMQMFSLDTDAAKLVTEFAQAMVLSFERNTWKKLADISDKLGNCVPPDYFNADELKHFKMDHPITPRLVERVYQGTMDYIAEKEGFSALGTADGLLFAGCMSGELVHPSVSMQQEGRHVLHRFGYPVNALCTIPEEVMNSGLRARITRNIQMRAVHARSRPAAMRRAA